MKQETVTSTNVFMSMIHDKPKGFFKRLRYESKLKKFRQDIINGSPGFGLLWRMADFIKLAEDCFFYQNTLDNDEFGLFSSRSYARGQNGFKVWDFESKITVKLISDKQNVMIEIERPRSATASNSNKSVLSFTSEEWDNDEHTVYDEMLLENIIRKINKKMIYLFDFYYDKW